MTLNQAMVHMLVTFAQFERRLIAQRTREALAVKKAAGVQLGRRRTVPQAVVRRIQRQRARRGSLASPDGHDTDANAVDFTVTSGRTTFLPPDPRRRAGRIGERWSTLGSIKSRHCGSGGESANAPTTNVGSAVTTNEGAVVALFPAVSPRVRRGLATA